MLAHIVKEACLDKRQKKRKGKVGRLGKLRGCGL